MKIFLKISVLVLISMLLLCGCSTPNGQNIGTPETSQKDGAQPEVSSTPSPTPTPTPKPKRQEELNIAVCVYNENSPQDILFLNGVESVFESKKNGYTIFDAKGSSETQNKQIEDAASGIYDAIIIKTQNPETIKESVSEANDLIPVIAIPGIDGVDTNYKINDKANELAKEASEKLVELLDEERRAVIISTGEPSDRLTQKKQAFIDTSQAKELKIVGNKTADSREEAVDIISNWMLAYPNIKGIWATDPEAASAAIEVVNVMERSDVNIGALGEDLDLIAALKDGKLAVLGAQNPETQGEAAARAALILGTGNYYPDNFEASYAVYTTDTYKEAASDLWHTEFEEDNEDDEEN